MNVPFRSRALFISLYGNLGGISNVLSCQYYSKTHLVICRDRVEDRFGVKKSFNSCWFTQNPTRNLLHLTSSSFPAQNSLRHSHPCAVSFFHTLCSGSHFNSEVSEKTRPRKDQLLQFMRHKSKKKRPNTNTDDRSESDSDDDDSLEDDDFDAPAQFKTQKIHVASLRIDAILSNALGLSRHRLEEIFFGPGILLNGQKVLKKAAKMEVGDYVDAVMDKTADEIKVKRVKLLKVESEKTSTEKFIIKVRVWKAPFLVNNPFSWKPQS